jgi:hypothetical protein
MANEVHATAFYQKRRRIASVGLMIWGLVGLLRIPYFATLWPATAVGGFSFTLS